MAKSNFSYYLGLGSNIGNRSQNLTQCLQHLKSIGTIKQTSFLYESQPMYYDQQSSFLNAAVHIESTQSPLTLLSNLKHIESNIMHRKSTFKNGPRIIDIDILCCFKDSKEVHLNDANNAYPLILPHPKICERNFVCTPLSDILPNYNLHSLNKSIHEQSQSLVLNNKSKHNLTQILPLKHDKKLHKIDNCDHTLKHKTLLMAILNITPDSFSDGGKFNQGIDTILDFLDHELNVNQTQIDIIDIGGQSTRPNSQRLTAEEELDRIMPVLERVRSNYPQIPISVDTYYSKVAKECVLNGFADIINDISGGRMDEFMYDIVSELCVPFICMHMRGNPLTMQRKYNLKYGQNEHDMNEFVDVLINELHQRVKEAEMCGIAAWNIVLDPGIGFAKNSLQNQYLLGCMDRIKNGQKYPVLSGCSRKSYLDSILGEEICQKGADSMEKVTGTQVGVTSSILSGADIIRVHDLYTMDITRKVADSLYNVNNDRNVDRECSRREQQIAK